MAKSEKLKRAIFTARRTQPEIGDSPHVSQQTWWEQTLPFSWATRPMLIMKRSSLRPHLRPSLNLDITTKIVPSLPCKAMTRT